MGCEPCGHEIWLGREEKKRLPDGKPNSVFATVNCHCQPDPIDPIAMFAETGLEILHPYDDEPRG